MAREQHSDSNIPVRLQAGVWAAEVVDSSTSSGWKLQRRAQMCCWWWWSGQQWQR